jgi:hypothetical protein
MKILRKVHGSKPITEKKNPQTGHPTLSLKDLDKEQTKHRTNKRKEFIHLCLKTHKIETESQ